jgi:hypothetical protein
MQRPWQIFGAVLVLSITTAPLAASENSPLLMLLAGVLAVLILFGFALLIIFGFPEPYSTALRRRITIASITVLGIAILSASVPVLRQPVAMPEWERISIGLPLVALIYAPFFIATSVLGDARRAVGQYKFGDCIGTWICVFSYWALGVFFVQKTVAMTLAALDVARPTNGENSGVA